MTARDSLLIALTAENALAASAARRLVDEHAAAIRETFLDELSAVRAELAEAKRASHCQSVAAINGARCALPVRHRGDHRNEQRNHYWEDEHAAGAEVVS